MSLEQKIIMLDDAAAVAQRSAEEFAALAAEVIARRGRLAVALSGGATPAGMYRRLAVPPLAGAIDWQRVHLFWGDERAVAPHHADSNYGMARQVLLAHLALPVANVHRMPADYYDLAVAAGSYANELRAFFDLPPGALPVFDLILLGLGTDGHVASLFPGTPALAERARLVAENPVPQLQTMRLTLTLPVINAAANVWFLVTGADKAEMVAHALQPGPAAPAIPARQVQPEHGAVTWFLDRAAAARLRL
ncbi:MAG: 6-phosphogluconolactonase [candidate division KSB1 bacterium]|nr:6-phosphogluconolactonase [candidate division KSB1 bacterium]MDZ7273354.1 6-phosphogluconolactonase [candidate division KSB1 bacterium]MDZ7288016.1 6-phosphogluconolactonase [candidate division KSB1 bacterium]MDZ7300132.1 6-phosphogluconolactonase [candidate division KSB1 bacterium]MDZ7308480.1 6-phosphogluconolactonase [candidate division KSB1 bacterium]